MSEAVSPYTVEERVLNGGTTWVAIRARGAEWSFLTPAEAARLGRQWVARYGGGTLAPGDENLLSAFPASE